MPTKNRRIEILHIIGHAETKIDNGYRTIITALCNDYDKRENASSLAGTVKRDRIALIEKLKAETS